MTKGQLAILPTPEGRKAERRVVNLAARLRDPGARLTEIDVLNLSTGGFMAQGELGLEPGSHAWLKLPGLEPQNCKLVWIKDGKAGFEFANPLHPATLEMLTAAGRKPIPRGHFGPQGGR
ncbi:PilZ domain-containing protein [Sphingosinicella sp. CPCC 101087]|uniref:PilZ domain-containing protein n=1 Tax=Sphingosinicella sp. CPCC 101087 TaxID=2497754 RepID=UPI00101BEABA|nr:PilZ domain-containing protein [Sphingosinicella sp. CPCC 101087]